MRRSTNKRLIGGAGVLGVIMLICLGTSPAGAQNFYNAGYYGAVANEYANYSFAQGALAYILMDSEALYYFYAYAEAAQATAGAAYAAAEAGYGANPTDTGYWALLSALYDWYYKYVVAQAAYAAYISTDYEGLLDSMEEAFLGDVVNGYSIFYCGVASIGGTQ